MDSYAIDHPTLIPTLPLLVPCRPLHPVIHFEEKNWEKIASAFADATPCEFSQAWRKKLHSHFSPAVVRAAWTPESFWVYAELTDVDIYNEARVLNEDTYQLGDTLEVFVRLPDRREYYEMHVSPDNQHLHLFYPRGKFPVPKEDCEVNDPDLFRSRVLLEPENQRWRVLAEFPIDKLRGDVISAGDEWKFSFGRYDYTRGEAHPVLSSTSPHHRPNFHDVKEWRTMRFEK